MDTFFQLEKLQAENAEEWAQREQLSSEKLALERENKRLRSEISRLEEEVDRQSQLSTSLSDVTVKSLRDV